MYQTNERCEKCGQRLHANGKKFVCLHCAAPTAQVETDGSGITDLALGLAVAEAIAEAIPVPDTPVDTPDTGTFEGFGGGDSGGAGASDGF